MLGSLLRSLEMLACGLLTLLAGCDGARIVAMYMPAPPKHDPAVQIVDFSYKPAIPRLGDTLRFAAAINGTFRSWYGTVKVEIGGSTAPAPGAAPPHLQVLLNDSGRDGDQTAGDGVWGGELEWLPGYGTQQELPVSARLEWADGYLTDPVHAALTVLPAEEE
jgi:hypothetical protein